MVRLGVSERRACKTIGLSRATHRYKTKENAFELKLVKRMIELAGEYGRYGYRQIAGMLRLEGWDVNHKRIERLWRREGLKVPAKQPKRSRLWLGDGSCIRRRAEYPNHVWSYDFIHERTHDGRALKMLMMVDERMPDN
jgi:putative transposase